MVGAILLVSAASQAAGCSSEHIPCECCHCWNLSVAEAAQSVHPSGHPISHSTHVGFSAPPTSRGRLH
jgi:hypothetical protein